MNQKQKYFNRSKMIDRIIYAINADDARSLSEGTKRTKPLVIGIFGVHKGGKSQFMNELSSAIFERTRVQSVLKGSVDEISRVILNTDFSDRHQSPATVLIAEEDSTSSFFEDQYDLLNFSTKERDLDDVISVIVEPCPRIVAFSLRNVSKEALGRSLSSLSFILWEGTIMPLINLGKQSYIDLMKQVVSRTSMRFDYINGKNDVVVITTNPLNPSLLYNERDRS